jgi:hypothetical protein
VTPPAAAAVDRVIEFAAQGNVAVDAVNHGAGQLALVRHLGEDVAPGGHVVVATVVDHDHAARLDIVDVVAHMPFFAVARRPVQHRVGMTGHAELGVAGLNLVALTGNAGTVQRVTQCGAIQRQCAGHKGRGRICSGHEGSVKV